MSLVSSICFAKTRTAICGTTVTTCVIHCYCNLVACFVLICRSVTSCAAGEMGIVSDATETPSGHVLVAGQNGLYEMESTGYTFRIY